MSTDRTTGAPPPRSTDSREPVRRPAAPAIPSIDELLGQLLRLNGTVVMGALSAKQASLVARNIKVVLDTQLRRANGQESAPNQEALADLCRRDPSLLGAITPFLADEQIRALMQVVAEDAGNDTSPLV